MFQTTGTNVQKYLKRSSDIITEKAEKNSANDSKMQLWAAVRFGLKNDSSSIFFISLK